MSEIKCKCKKSAIKICKQHRLYLCNNCSQDHKCNQISLKIFKKELDETYMNKMSIFQNFKKQRSNFLYSSKKTHEESHQKSHESIKNLENIFDKYLEIVKTKQNTFLKNMMDFKQDKLEDELRSLERSKKQFQLLDKLNSGEIDTIEQKFNTISFQIKEFDKNNILTQTVQQILEDMTKKFKEQFEYLQGTNFYKIDDMIKSAKKISEIYFSQKSANQIKKNIKKSIMLTQTVIKQTVLINTVNEKLEDSNSQINSDIGSLNSDEMEIDTSEDEIIINNNLQARGTQLISNDIFKSNLNPRNHQLDQVKEQSLEEDLSGSNLSFEVDDIELEDDVDSIQRDYQEDFQRNKNRFCAILDQVLFDVNCIGFFDKNERNQIYQYFDQLKVTLNQLVGDLKSNFSKMQLIPEIIYK